MGNEKVLVEQRILCGLSNYNLALGYGSGAVAVNTHHLLSHTPMHLFKKIQKNIVEYILNINFLFFKR